MQLGKVVTVENVVDVELSQEAVTASPEATNVEVVAEAATVTVNA